MNVMIPTKGRPDKLLTCVASIPTWVTVSIVGTQESDVPFELYERENTFIVIDGTLTVSRAFNYMASLFDDDVVLSSDDIEYAPDAFDALVGMLVKHGRDIVIGMHVTNMKCNDDAFQCVGREFKRKHSPLYCEEYKHFYIDTEVGDLARSLGKFVYCADAKLKNFHPASGCPADATHSVGRNEKLAHDQEVYERRKGLRVLIPQECV